MKRNLLITVALTFSSILLQSFGDGNGKYPGGSPGGYSGSPFDNKSCKYCHNGQALPVTNWITSNVPATGYIPGTAYTITVTATGSGKKGFEVSPQSLTGVVQGSLTPGIGTHMVNSNKAITHSSASNAATASWTFTWTAPAAGTGTVTFYGAIIVGLSNTKLCTLGVLENSVGLPETSATVLDVFPNPCSDRIRISTFIGIPTNVKVNLYNLQGEVCATLLQEMIPSGNLNKDLTIPSNLKKGIYFLSLSGKNINITRKIFVNNDFGR